MQCKSLLDTMHKCKCKAVILMLCSHCRQIRIRCQIRFLGLSVVHFFHLEFCLTNNFCLCLTFQGLSEKSNLGKVVCVLAYLGYTKTNTHAYTHTGSRPLLCCDSRENLPLHLKVNSLSSLSLPHLLHFKPSTCPQSTFPPSPSPFLSAST